MFACTDCLHMYITHVRTCMCSNSQQYPITVLDLRHVLKAAVRTVKMDPLFLVSNRRILPALLCLICALVSQAVAQGTGDKACDAPTGTGSGSTCMCQTDAGKVIDLTPLSRSDGKAKYVEYEQVFCVSHHFNVSISFIQQLNTLVSGMLGYCSVPWAWPALPVGMYMHGILLSDEIPCSLWSTAWLCFKGVRCGFVGAPVCVGVHR